MGFDRRARPGVVTGRLVGPTCEIPAERTGTVSTYLRWLPPRTRSKAEIDQQLAEERDSWSLSRDESSRVPEPAVEKD